MWGRPAATGGELSHRWPTVCLCTRLTVGLLLSLGPPAGGDFGTIKQNATGIALSDRLGRPADSGSRHKECILARSSSRRFDVMRIGIAMSGIWHKTSLPTDRFPTGQRPEGCACGAVWWKRPNGATPNTNFLSEPVTSVAAQGRACRTLYLTGRGWRNPLAGSILRRYLPGPRSMVVWWCCGSSEPPAIAAANGWKG